MKASLSGLRAWALQRITALALLPLMAIFVGRLLLWPPATHAAWREWMQTPWVQAGVVLFFVASALHAWVGSRDVVIDYVKPLGLRIALLGVIVLTLTWTVVWAAMAVLR